MTASNKPPLIVAMTGASGAYAAQLLLAKSPWPTLLMASRWAKEVFARECGSFEALAQTAGRVYDADDLTAPPASGSTETIGMVILPCSVNTLGRIANGLADNLITRAAHCHLKERRPLILGVREAPLTSIDLQNAVRVSAAGAIIMPITPPFFMFKGKTPHQISLHDLMDAFVERVLSLLGRRMAETWEDML
ncbi:MAG: UbiX family flavin prenyltransferase [Desulfobacteraceae bacterium]|nr:MAG: UbiX family flavin prenyltransferase [Desulfobacteraceae bacterium]